MPPASERPRHADADGKHVIGNKLAEVSPSARKAIGLDTSRFVD